MTAPLPRLHTLLTGGTLPPRAAKRCAQLVQQLGAPVRVGLFGLPGSGKVALAHALAQGRVFGEGQLTAPCLLRHAERGELSVTDAEGETVKEPIEMPVRLPPDAMYAEVSLSLAPLRKMSLLCVVADPDPEDMAAALRWATPRCDIAIWCSRAWTQAEQDIWAGAPERLKDHALVVRSGIKPPPVTAITGGPEHIHCPTLDDVPGAALLVPSSDVLRAHLDKIIAEARAEDIDAAHVFLAQYDEAAPEAPLASKPAPRPARASRPVSRPLSKAVSRPAPAPPVGPTPQARAVLSRLFLQTRQCARTLAAQVPQESPRDAEAAEALPLVQEALEAMVETAEAEDTFAEAWPELTETLRDAGELSLLMGLEGGAAGLEEAAVLLAQIRQDMEFALAA